MNKHQMPSDSSLSDCKIHLAIPRQIKAVAGLLATQLDEHGILSTKTALTKNLALVARRKSLGFVLVLTDSRREVIGAALGCSQMSLEHGGISGWLEEFYILPKFRNRGLGERMLNEFIKTAKKLGWRAIDLEVDAHHRRVISLYRRSGFTELPRRRLVRSLT